MTVRTLATVLAVLALGSAQARAVFVDLAFDAQTFDLIQSVGTTESGFLAFNGADAGPANFNTFTGHSSASISVDGITVEMTGILGSWSGNSSSAVLSNPLRADYFIVQTGQTGTLSFSGLDAGASYGITFTHGNAEPQQSRGLDFVGLGGSSDIDNLTGGTPEVTFGFTADPLGEIHVGMVGLGVQEGNLAGFRIVGGEVAPIPEPSTYGLLAVGMLVLGVALRKRR